MTHDPNEWNPMLPHLDVPEHKSKKTGLVDVRGRPIKRYPRPVGFHLPPAKPRG